MTTRVYVVRHAKAGDRSRWDGDDRLRPLSKPGRKQAEALLATLGDAGIERVLSSPYLRCTQTLDPLAGSLGLEISTDDALAEGASLGRTHELIRRVADRPTVLCTHGDVIENLIGGLAETGTPGIDGLRWKKGSTWVLAVSDETIVAATYLPPSVS